MIRPMAGGQITIRVKKGFQPRQQYTTRQVPINLREAFEQEVQDQIDKGILEWAEDLGDPSEWLHPMVVVRKKETNKVRLTVDLRELNKATVRPVHLAPAPGKVMAEVNPRAGYFTVLDGYKGFHQVDLDAASRRLTTFVTPLGRLRYRRMPMGWHGASDVFGERMAKALQGIPHVHRVVEDILIATETWEEHIILVEQVLKACDESNIAINTDKVQFGQQQVKFSGYRVYRGGYDINPDLVQGLTDFPAPECRKDLRAFFGLAEQLGTFTSQISETMEPLRGLNTDKAAWTWTPHHETAFRKVKGLLSRTMTLTGYDPRAETELITDASRSGLGFILRQRDKKGIWRAVQCGSRALAGHEANWSAVSELEALAVAWAVSKCAFFLDGTPHFTVVTDCNPLLAIFNTKSYADIENDRLLKLKTKLERYNFTVVWRAGTTNKMADALSRATTKIPIDADIILPVAEDSEREFVVAALEEDMNMQEIRTKAENDVEYKEVSRLIQKGWPHSKQELLATCSPDAAPYFRFRDELTIECGVILYGRRALVPNEMRRAALQTLHAAHQGLTKTTDRAKETVWWPGINQDIEKTVKACQTCRARLPAQAHEPLQRERPRAEHNFQRWHADLFQADDGDKYLVLVDEKSDWPCLYKMGSDTTAVAIVRALRQLFAQYGVPESIKFDGGPQFTATLVQEFLQGWHVRQELSIPHLHRTNGKAETTVKVLKKLVAGTAKDEGAFVAGMIALRNTGIEGGVSPAVTVYGRAMRETLLRPSQVGPEDVVERQKHAETQRETRRQKYDEHAHLLPPLTIGKEVLIEDHVTKRWTIRAKVVQQTGPSEYWVEPARGGKLRRSRVQLREAANEQQEAQTAPQEPSPQQTKRPERIRRAPERLDL